MVDVEQIERFPAGKVLFSEGEQPHGVYVLHSGEVDLVYSGRNGASKTLRIAHPGSSVGLSDAISDTAHDCTATTRTPARVGFIPLSDFRRALNETPSLWFTVLQLLSEDVNACWASMRELGARH